MKKKVTIYDIAKEVNFSPSTVSRVLGNSKRPVNPEIRQIVEEAAKKMEYYPNTMARNLKTNNNNTIGVILPSIANPFYPSIVRGIEDEAILNNYSISLCSCDHEKGRMNEYFEKLIENRVKGLIAIHLDCIPTAMNNFISRDGKVLTVGTKKQSFPYCGTIAFDKEAEAYTVTKHLLELGHREIAIFLSSINNHIRQEKLSGYKKALAEYNIKDYEKHIFIKEEHSVSSEPIDSSPDCSTGIYCAQKLLENENNVTGIVCMNDLVALGCISEIKKLGYSIPEDYSIIGFDDSFFSSLIEPQITTLRIDKYQLGKSAMQLMIEMLKSNTSSIRKDFSDQVELVIRNSTCAPKSI
jgi:LacI family transcriptional regulator